MGSLLDSSAVVRAERARQTAREFLSSVQDTIGNQPVILSAIGYTELLHGVYRDREPERRRTRERFLAELLEAVPVHAYTLQTSVIAARVGADAAARGETIPFADLLIGAAALSLGFSVLTSNERHFRLIPGLSVLPY